MNKLNIKQLTFIPNIDLDDIFLRPINIKDVKDIFEFTSDPLVTKYLFWNPHKFYEETLLFIKNIHLTKPENNLPVSYVIVNKLNDKVIGLAGFVNMQIEKSTVEIIYLLNRKYWQKGYITRVCKELINFGFKYLNVNTIEIGHVVDNIASERVIEKCKFKFLYKKYIVKQNVYIKQYYLKRND